MEKTGFIYIWYDRKRKMYYVGCHWGTMNDGYICSSNRMRNAYRRRPQDFKRRVVKTGLQRENMLEEEHKWLSLIPKNLLGKKYYNLSVKHFGHWSTNLQSRSTTKQKLSESIKKLHKDPIYKQKFIEGRKKLVGRVQSEEEKNKRAKSNRGKKRTEEIKRKQRESWTEERKHKARENMLGDKNHFYGDRRFAGVNNPFYGKTHTDEFKKMIGEKTSKRLKGKVPKNIEMIRGSFWWNNGTINKRSKSCPGEEWTKGPLKKNKTGT